MYRVSSRESVVSRDAEMLKISIGVNVRPASRSIRVASADMISPFSETFPLRLHAETGCCSPGECAGEDQLQSPPAPCRGFDN